MEQAIELDSIDRLEASTRDIEPSTSIEFIAYTLGGIDWLKQRVAAAEKEFKERCIKWIQANGRPIEFSNGPDSTMKLYVGVRKDTKCRDVQRTLERLLEISGGDMAAVTCCLATNAWKHGAARKLLIELEQQGEYEKLFETVEVAVLKGIEPTPELIKFESRFLRS